MVGYYSEYENTENSNNTEYTNKKMKFKVNGNLEDKFIIFLIILKKKSGFDHIDYVYEIPTTGFEYLKTAVSKNSLFDKDNFCLIPNSNAKYLCNVALQVQSVYPSTKDKDQDVRYYLQVLLDQCCYEVFVDTRKNDQHLKCEKLDSCLKCKKKPESESEPEYNEDTVFDESE